MNALSRERFQYVSNVAQEQSRLTVVVKLHHPLPPFCYTVFTTAAETNMQMVELAYLAGILDADGYFTIKRSTYHMRVRGDAGAPVFSEKVGIKQVQPEAINLLESLFGGYRRMEMPSAKHGKPLHSWSVTDKKAAAVARALLPYLRIKKRQAAFLLELRISKNLPRSETREGSQRNRWGTEMIVKKKVVSEVVLQKRERLHTAIRELNDGRVHQPVLI